MLQCLPDFIVIGTARSASTTLYDLLVRGKLRRYLPSENPILTSAMDALVIAGGASFNRNV